MCAIDKCKIERILILSLSEVIDNEKIGIESF